MSQTFKPKTDISFNLFLNELSTFTPLWSSIDEGLTSPTDSDFIQIDPIVGTFGNNVTIGGYLNCGTSKPDFNKFRISGIQGKYRIDTAGVDVSVSVRLFDKNFVHVIASSRVTVNTSGFTDVIVDMTVNLTDIDDWVLDEAVIHISVGNVATSSFPSQLVNTKVSVFEIEVLTFNDCIIERLPQADGEFFIPTTWENELNVNHLLWESVVTSGDAEFIKSVSSEASGDTLFEFQGVGRIPESGLFRFRARNNGVDDSALDDISLYDNLTHSIVGSGHLAHFELSGEYNTYEASLTFLQTGFLPSSLYTVGTEISATGVLGIADTEISTQQLTLFMSNSYCCLSQGEQNTTTQPALVDTTDSNINTHNINLFITLPGGVNDSFFKFIDDDFENPTVADLDSVTYRDSLWIPILPIGQNPKFERIIMTDQNFPDYHHYVQFEPMTAKPDTLVVKFRLRANKLTSPLQQTSAHIGVTLTDGLVTGDISNPNTPNHIMELNNFIILNPSAISNGFITTQTVTFDLTVLNNNQYNSFNLHPKVAFVVWHEQQIINPSNGLTETQFSLMDMDITVVEIEYTLSENIATCTQFSYPRSDTAELTVGIWEDNRGGPFTNKWNTVDQGVATFNDDNHITYPTQVGQTTFPKIGFGMDQITLDPTSIKLNFRGGGIEPSGSVAHTMTFAALYDTNGLVVATNGSTPIASLSGDLRSYTVNMSLAIANKDLWDLSRPQLEMKFFVSDAGDKDLRFSEVEIETCGTCPERDTGNITLVLENLDDCEPENIIRPNTDLAILPSGEWTLCGEIVDNCLKINAFAGNAIEKCPGLLNPLFIPAQLSAEEMTWQNPNNILSNESAVAIAGRTYIVSEENVSQLELVTSCTLIGTNFDFFNKLPSNVDKITGLKFIMRRRGVVVDNIFEVLGSSVFSLLESSIYILRFDQQTGSFVPNSKNKFNTYNEPTDEVIQTTFSSFDPNTRFTHWVDNTTNDVSYGTTCGTKINNDIYWGSENGITLQMITDPNFAMGIEIVSQMTSTVFGGTIILGSIAAHVDSFKVELSYTTLDGGGGTVEAQAWPCVNQDINDVTDLTNIKLRELSQNRPTTIYWTERGFGASSPHDVPQTNNMAIYKSDMIGENRITVLEAPEVESPNNLVVDWVHDYLYFSESGGVVLQRCELDGSNLIDIADLSAYQIEDIFIDFDEKRLYFTSSLSGGNGTIEYLNLPSGGIPQNWATGFNHPVGLWKYQDDMFVTDVADDTLYTTTGGSSKTAIVNNLNTPSGLTADACDGMAYIVNWSNTGDISRMSFSNPVPQIIVSGIQIHDVSLDSRNGLLYYTEWGDTDPFTASKSQLKRVQVDGDGPVALRTDLQLGMKLSIDTAPEKTHTSTLQFGLTDLSRCCLGPTSGYVSIKGAELSKPNSIDSFAYIKAKIINPSGDVLWSGRNEPAKIEDNDGAIQIDTIGFHNQATNPDFANRTDWADAILQLDIEQFLQPIQPTGFGCPQLDAAFDLYAAQFHVTACSGIEDAKAMTLFVDGSGDLSEVMTLYTRSGFLDSDSINPLPLILINNAKPANANTQLFVEGFGDLLNNDTTLFVETLLSESGNTDLFITSFIEHSGNMNLFIDGSLGPLFTATTNIFLEQKDITPINTLSLFITTPATFTDTMTLFTNAVITHSGEMNLFTQAQDGAKTVDLFLENKEINDNLNLVIIAPDGNFNNDNTKLIIHGATISGQFTATTFFTKVDLVFNDNMILFTSGPPFSEITSNMNLVLIGRNHFGQTSLFMSQNEVFFNNNKPLFLGGPPTASNSGTMNLFMARENDSIASFHPTLFVATVTPESGNPTMFIDGGQDVVNNITLFHKGAPIPSSDFQELYVHGF